MSAFLSSVMYLYAGKFNDTYSTMMILFFTLILVAHQSSASSECTYSKQRGVLTADCTNKKIEEVPQDIRPETEVLDLSGNELQQLHNNSFNCCTNVKRLYLRNNVMTLIENGTFARMTNLIALDLSENAMKALPYLPNNLQKLYLSRIPALFSPYGSDPMIEISRLTLLDTLDLSKNRLQQFPKFTGDMYNLVHLNLSGNYISDMTADHLAGFCQLKYLNVDPLRTTDSKENYCSCLEIRKWAATHNMDLEKLSTCEPSQKLKFNCDPMPRNSTEEIYRRRCTKKISRYLIVFETVGIVLVIIFLVVSLYVWCCVRRRNKRKANLLNQNDETFNEICMDLSLRDPQIRLLKPPARKETEV